MLALSPWMLALVCCLTSGILVFSTVPSMRRLASRNGMVDLPGGRKRHLAPTPTCGGIAIFAGLMPAFLSLLFLSFVREPTWSVENGAKLVSLLIGSAWILLIGTLDDRSNLRWSVKLAGQAVGVMIVVLGGHTVTGVEIPFAGPVAFGPLGAVILALFVIVTMNAINFIDGLDGLAVGICLFAGIAGGLIGYLKGDLTVCILQATLAGALIGFLPYNWPPARAFLGDGGSMMLGFFLGTMALSNATVSAPGQRPVMFATLLAPFLPLSIAFLDVILAILRRWVRGGKIYLPDADHVHHRLAEEFKSVKKVNLVVYSFSAAFAALSVLFAVRPQWGMSGTGLTVLAGVFTMLCALLLRAYRINRIDRFTRALSERFHFKYLDLYSQFMAASLARSQSVVDCIELLESGVRDLRFDSVQVYRHDTLIRRWDNPEPVHVGSNRSIVTNRFQASDLLLKAVVPEHDRKSYNNCLLAAWSEFLKAFGERLPGVIHVAGVERETVDLYQVEQLSILDRMVPAERKQGSRHRGALTG